MSSDLVGRNGNSHGFDLQANGTDRLDTKALRRHVISSMTRTESPANEKASRRLVERVAGEAGLSLSPFLTNDALSSYFAIKRGRHVLGYVAKGWGDPGFWVGEMLMFEAYREVDFIWTGTEIKRFCATNGIGITFDQHGETTEVHLDSVIYLEGFNRVTLLKTLEALNLCVEKIETSSQRH